MEPNEVMRVTADELKQRMDRGEKLAFLDVRKPQAWEKSSEQIVGSIRIPPDEIERRIGELPHDRSIVTYCT